MTAEYALLLNISCYQWNLRVDVDKTKLLFLINECRYLFRWR